jgi:DNA replication protein DnaC
MPGSGQSKASRACPIGCKRRSKNPPVKQPSRSVAPELRLQRQLAAYKLLIIDELGYVPLSQTGAELLFEVFSQRYERGSTIVTSNLPFDEWTSVFGSERLTGALLDRLTHHVHILEMNGESYRLAHSKRRAHRAKPDNPPDDTSQE